MKRWILHCPNPIDGSSFYRGYGPFGRLTKDTDIVVEAVPEYSWPVFSFFHGLIMQRPSTEMEWKIASSAKMNGLPVVLDFDDNIFAVPEWHPNYALREERNKWTASIAKMADVIMVSTKELARVFRRLNKKTVVVPNAMPYGKWPERQEPVKHIMWRGNTKAQDDFKGGFLEGLDQALKQHEGWGLSFLGQPPDRVREALPGAHYIPTVDVVAFYRFMASVRPDILIVPREDSPFNRARSNGGWLEATYAGAAVLAPDWEEWRRPGITNYKDARDFGKKLSQLMQRDVSPLVAESRAYIDQHLQLAHVNKQREEILRSLS